MPEPGNCCETQVAAQAQNPVELLSVEPSKSAEPTPKCMANDHDDRKTAETVNSKLRASRGCPKIEPCPGKAALERHQYVPEERDGDRIALERERNMPPGPLGPVPTVSPGESIPLEYWAPLGSLTGTRPAVENFSLSRFSPKEWREHNEKISSECLEGIQVATIAGYNAHCSLSRAYAETDKNQLDNNIRLNVRSGIIYRWKTELNRTISKIVEEIDSVQEVRRRVMRAKSILQLVENIGEDVNRIRCFHVDTDLVRDQVTEEVIKELSLCEEVNDVYVRLLDQIKMQIDELRTAKQRLEFDWSEKTEAYEIDSNSRGFNSESNTILWKSGSVRIPPDQSSSSGYEFSVREIIREGQTAKKRSNTLRVNVDSIIEKAVRDLRDQADRVDLALTEQIQLHEQAARRLEVELRKDLHQLSDTEFMIDGIRDASKRMDGAMKCAQTRLDNRLLRHGVESCRDVAEFGLIEEVKSLSENVTATLGQMKRTEDSTKGLIHSRRSIERELIIKSKSLYADRERCQLLRNFYPSFQALAGN